MPERHIEADPNPLLTIGEVADLFKVSVRTVHRYIASGQLEVVRLPGGQARVRRSAVDAALTEAPSA